MKIIHCKKTLEISNSGFIAKLNVQEVTVKETVVEGTLIKSILKILLKREKLDLGKEELTYILKNIFRLTHELANEIAEGAEENSK